MSGAVKARIGVTGVGLLLCGCYTGAGPSPAADDPDAATDGAADGDGDDDGDDDSGEPSDGDSGDGDPDCVAGALEIAAAPTQRLTRAHYEASLRSLFGDPAVDAAANQLALVPETSADGSFASADSTVSGSHLTAYYAVADKVAAEVTADPDALAATHACLPALLEQAPSATAPDDACVAAFVEDLAARAYRHPPSQDERDALVDTFFSDAPSNGDRIADTVVFALLSPAFLYRLELGGPELEPDHFQLTGSELAVRLSYTLFGEPPDVALIEAAERGDLEDGATLRDTVDGMLDDVRAHVGLADFSRQWLGLSTRTPPPLDEDALDGVVLDGLADAARLEVEQLLGAWVLDDGARFDEVMSATEAFPNHPGLATIYGVELEPEGSVELEASRRGLLTRAGLLFGGERITQPILRGAFVTRQLLCVDLELPELPADAVQPPPFDPSASNRSRWEERTSSPECSGCHTILNPFGFVAERYDSLGRWRDEEEVIDPETGAVLGTLPLDTSVSVVLDATMREFDDLGDLTAALGQSQQAQQCFAEQWFTHLFGRSTEVADACAVETMTTLVGEMGIRELLLEILTSDAFTTRKVSQ